MIMVAQTPMAFTRLIKLHSYMNLWATIEESNGNEHQKQMEFRSSKQRRI
ncbi:hypothetical protein Tcan_07685 [Toxocara canis]|uniref:Uncharacterized protein n=1 Tax=Toxocara canis TaxID=6265 RepID=A0A0B2VJN9_TOXCA|nr:hypothetical protein Tcan_07685 [Toxocara canis]